jgi:hypothetical protein
MVADMAIMFWSDTTMVWRLCTGTYPIYNARLGKLFRQVTFWRKEGAQAGVLDRTFILKFDTRVFPLTQWRFSILTIIRSGVHRSPFLLKRFPTWTGDMGGPEVRKVPEETTGHGKYTIIPSEEAIPSVRFRKSMECRFPLYANSMEWAVVHPCPQVENFGSGKTLI